MNDGRRLAVFLLGGLFFALLVLGSSATAQQSGALDPTLPTLRAAIARFGEDERLLDRRYPLTLSPARQARQREFLDEWRAWLEQVDFDRLEREGQIDWILFDRHLKWSAQELDYERARDDEVRAVLPFVDRIVPLLEARYERESCDPAEAAETLHQVRGEVETATAAVRAGETSASASLARRAAMRLDSMVRDLERWFRFRDEYDPLFTWWVSEPYEALVPVLREHADLLRRELAGIVTGDELIGDPIGADALRAALLHEGIPYTAEELVDIALQEFAWCDRQMLAASQELGFGDDWHAALEHVKGLHVEPGKQTELIRFLADEATEFVESRDLLTVPAFCKESWRIEMMSPARQKVNPYFTGGEVISVSFPTADMDHSDKRMSLRGNNEHFSRAVVHHELIPGHHLQLFTMPRVRNHRRPFATPFWLEGWALYWEMRLWDLDFARGAEDRVGMLFWRMHRCARIVFSLDFHLGRRSGPECVDFLAERVGHERRNAEAEVRRSIAGDYSPLYQAAYMLGGLQIRALHRELVEQGEWEEKAFHDAVLHENSIPIAIVREDLRGEELRRDWKPNWRFYEGAVQGLESGRGTR